MGAEAGETDSGRRTDEQRPKLRPQDEGCGSFEQAEGAVMLDWQIHF